MSFTNRKFEVATMTFSNTLPRIYLAGPDVFLPQVSELFEAKKKICLEHGLLGCSPLDNELKLKKLAPTAAGLAIARANEQLMQTCDAIIANLTPWDGPSADVGTAFEVGFMRALGKPCFAYSNDPRGFEQRVEVHALDNDLGPIGRTADGQKCTGSGRVIEAFQMHDNLMLDGAVHMSGGCFAPGALQPWMQGYHTDLTAFYRAVAACARHFGCHDGQQDCQSVIKVCEENASL